MDDLSSEAHRLFKASLAPATWTAYASNLESFIQFRKSYNLELWWPALTQHIISYISHLSISGLSSSTICAHVSAIAFAHKANGWRDPSDNFIVKKILEGCRRDNPGVDNRLPITSDILKRLISVLMAICKSQYEYLLFRAAFALAFFGFLRVGEFTCSSKKASSERILSIQDVSFQGQGSLQTSLLITIRYSKTDQRGLRSYLRIDGAGESPVCPVKAMLDFLKVRPNHQGALFIHFDAAPLTSYQFNHILKTGIRVIGLPQDKYSSHSFRIGAATMAAKNGFSEDEIKQMGRWKSSAVQIYVRPQQMC